MKNMFLTIDAFSSEELAHIIQYAEKIKASPRSYANALQGKGLGIIFEKPSTRTRVSFQVGVSQLGGCSHYLAPHEIQLGEREEVRDIARTVSRYLDAVVLRTFRHATITEFAQYATIPVINGLSDYSHPCQAMADYLTIKEKFDNPQDVTLAYIGDGNNVLHSLMILMGKLGVSMTIATPKGYEPNQEILSAAMAYAKDAGSRIFLCGSPEEAVAQADVVYTDVFVSMGEEDAREEKLQAFDGFQLNDALLAHAAKKPLIMHCLPAHRGEEITDAVIESAESIVFDQAENRLHAQKGILYYLLSDCKQ